eukprot:4797853-Pleurochrysis_carterae.AAC.2
MYAQSLPRTPLFGVYLVNDASSHGQGANAGEGAKRTYGAAQARGRSAGRGGLREEGSKSLRSGARALRKYACNASPKRQIVHVSINCK